MNNSTLYIILFGVFILTCYSCEEETGNDESNDLISLEDIEYNPIAFEVDSPPGYPLLVSPDDNPLTEDGINLGRHLFYDPILSVDSTMSCASCHDLQLSFTDASATSIGVDGLSGMRNSMSLVNIGYNYRGLFWDGRVQTLEEQALLPIEDPIELHHSWTDLVDQLRRHEDYPRLFRKAFGITNTEGITKELAAKAIAQFERILISGGNSKYNKVKYLNTDVFTDSELHGEDLFIDTGDSDVIDAECSHCHNGGLFMGDDFFNNGLDSTADYTNLLDLGRGGVTGFDVDKGKFKAPTLRNITITAPYMHDGRFNTLDEVIEHYNSGGHPAPNVDQNIKMLNLSDYDKQALLDFLSTLTDTTYKYPELVSNPHN